MNVPAHTPTRGARRTTGSIFSTFRLALWGSSYMNIQSQTRRIQRDGVTALMKNKIPLFPSISSPCYYHTDRSLTFLPATLEANEKSLGWKMQHQTCDLFRGVIKNRKQAQIVNQWNWLRQKCAGGLETLSKNTPIYIFLPSLYQLHRFCYGEWSILRQNDEGIAAPNIEQCLFDFVVCLSKYMLFAVHPASVKEQHAHHILPLAPCALEDAF